MIDVEGMRTFNSQNINDEEGRLLRCNGLIGGEWVRWLHKKLNTNVLYLDQSIVDDLVQWTCGRLLDDAPSRYKEEAIRVLANRKAVGPDGLAAELLSVLAESIEHCRNIQRHHRRYVKGRGRAAPKGLCNDRGLSQEERSD